MPHSAQLVIAFDGTCSLVIRHLDQFGAACLGTLTRACGASATRKQNPDVRIAAAHFRIPAGPSRRPAVLLHLRRDAQAVDLVLLGPLASTLVSAAVADRAAAFNDDRDCALLVDATEHGSDPGVVA